jgi:iron complex outermembrane recepter protein
MTSSSLLALIAALGAADAGTLAADTPATTSSTAAAAAAAAHAPPVDETEIVVVTASALGDRQDRVAQGVSVLSAAEAVTGSIGGTLGETLAGLPGVRATFYGPNASRPVIRGLGEDRIRVLSNGLTGIDASTQSPDHAPTADGLEATSIEVLRGPSALRYGGNAIGGVVNVVTGLIPLSPVEGRVDGAAFAGVSTAEEARSAGAAVTLDAGGGLKLRAEGWRRESGDYAIPGFVESERLRRAEGEEDDEAERGTVPNSAGEASAMGLGIGWTGAGIEAGLGVRGQSSLYGIPGTHHDHHGDEDHGDDHGDDHEEEEGGPVIDLEQTRVDARLAFLSLPVFESVSLAATWGDYEHAEIEPGGEVGTVFANTGWEARVEAKQQPRELGSLVWTGLSGIQLGRNDFSAVGEEAFVPPVEIAQRGIFAVQRLDWGQMRLEGGARLEHRSYETATRKRAFDLASFALSAGWTPDERLTATLSVSRTERAPTEIELFADGPHVATSTYEIGNPDLEIESGLSLEASARWRSGPLALDASLWRIDFQNFATFLPTGAVIDDLPVVVIFQEDALLTGGEVGARLALGQAGPLEWSLSADVDWVEGRYDRAGPIPRIPPVTATLGVDATGDIWRARAWVTHSADQTDVSAKELPTDSATTLNARLGWKPVETEGRVEIVLEGTNLTDAEVREHTSFLKDLLPKPGRSIRLSVRATF